MSRTSRIPLGELDLESVGEALREPLFEYVLGLGDDLLVLGHRLSEWCGHAPTVEEDIALANIALDCLGQASHLLALAGAIEGNGRDADALAFFREVTAFRNCILVEQPNGHFGTTIVRQVLYSTFSFHLLAALRTSTFPPLAAFGAKAIKEVAYHLRHSQEWLIRLGNGTEESALRMQSAIDALWPFAAELFESSLGEEVLWANQVAPERAEIRTSWSSSVGDAMGQAGLVVPEVGALFGIAEEGTSGSSLKQQEMWSGGGRRGHHTEQFGRVLAEMQSVARSFPNAKW